MLLLHGALTPTGDLLAWARVEPADGAEGDWQPASAAAVGESLGELLAAAVADDAIVATPARLPYGEREVAAGRLAPADAITLVRACASRERLPARGVTPGAEFEALAALVRRYAPRVLAVCGITAWRTAFDRPRATLGRQPERIGGAVTWVVPNPSGLNAHHQLPDLARLYGQLRSG